MNIEGERGKPNKKWLDAIGCDLRTAGMCIEDVGDHVKIKDTGGQTQIAGMEFICVITAAFHICN